MSSHSDTFLEMSKHGRCHEDRGHKLLGSAGLSYHWIGNIFVGSTLDHYYFIRYCIQCITWREKNVYIHVWNA